jgi:hypothetical protein
MAGQRRPTSARRPDPGSPVAGASVSQSPAVPGLAPHADAADDDSGRVRRIAYRWLWVASQLVCPAAIWVVGYLSTRGPRDPDSTFGHREPVVDLGYLLGAHLLIACFAAWAAHSVWGRYWLVGWAVVLLAALGTWVVTVGVAISIFYTR